MSADCQRPALAELALVRWRHTVMNLLAALALAACGGGGGGSGSGSDGVGGGGSGAGGTDSGAASTNNRVARLLYDFDGNGTNEGVMAISYDAAGRVLQETYTYTDDGTPDADFDTFCLTCIGGVGDTTSGSVRYTYDAQGRLATLTTQPDGGPANVVTYTRDADGRVRLADLGGATATLTYAGDRLSTVSLSSGATLISNYSLAYDASNRVETDTLTSNLPGNPDVRRYTWDGAGRVQVIDTSRGSTFHHEVTFTYEASGQPQRRTQVDLIGSDDYTWAWFYGADRRMEIDLGNNGSVDAVVRVELESGPCRPVTLWAPRAEPNFPQPGNGPFRPGTGYADLLHCVP